VAYNDKPDTPKKRKQRVRGAKRMKQLGKRAVMVWLDPADYTRIWLVARRQGKKVAAWIRETALAAAPTEV
jgi:hypothetical protein